jgi:hypothetical protein
VESAFRRWWADESAPPVISLTSQGRAPGRPEPVLEFRRFIPHYDLSVEPERIADRWAYELECTCFSVTVSRLLSPILVPG